MDFKSFHVPVKESLSGQKLLPQVQPLIILVNIMEWGSQLPSKIYIKSWHDAGHILGAAIGRIQEDKWGENVSSLPLDEGKYVRLVSQLATAGFNVVLIKHGVIFWKIINEMLQKVKPKFTELEKTDLWEAFLFSSLFFKVLRFHKSIQEQKEPPTLYNDLLLFFIMKSFPLWIKKEALERFLFLVSNLGLLVSCLELSKEFRIWLD